MKMIEALVGAVLALACGHAAGHGGGLDSSGCHHNRKTGDYHCHRAPSVIPQAFQDRAAQTTSKGAQQPVSLPSAPTCYVGPRGDVVCLERFGASAPGDVALKNLGFNVDNVVARARALLAKL